MHRFNRRFSLVAMVLCFGLISGAGAAPSVRVLGSSTGSSVGKTTGTTGTKVSGVKTGNTIKSSVLNANTGAKKSASVKTMSPTTTTMQPIARTSSGRVGTAGTGTVATVAGANRFPGIASKTNVQKSYSPATTGTITSTDPNARGYNIQEMNERLDVLEEDITGKAQKIDLDNYYTKEEIEEKYYTTAQVDDKINSITLEVPPLYIDALTEKIQENATDILNLKGQSQYIYDMNSGTKKSVYLVTDFDENSFFGETVAVSGD